MVFANALMPDVKKLGGWLHAFDTEQYMTHDLSCANIYSLVHASSMSSTLTTMITLCKSVLYKQ